MKGKHPSVETIMGTLFPHIEYTCTECQTTHAIVVQVIGNEVDLVRKALLDYIPAVWNVVVKPYTNKQEE